MPWTAVLLALALCNGAVGAAPSAPESAAPAAAAMRVERDPVTGTLTPAGPTADPMLMPLWSFTMRPRLETLTAARLPDGSLMLDLDGIYLDFATAHRGWDGRPVVDCDLAFTPDVLRPLVLPSRPAPDPRALPWAEE